ncbi:hypothetical protein Ahy_A02g009884 [Arachis hypogaea]|uniref:Disease resistance N-terminal domain-containing protein n=1 Tax=Arachis hypogaea TaxID=3818 RepID=A0A445EIP1_ARAHY|nr:hypothetical protein Ahy_A02g009884 [Arachis hypogaea]
MEAEDVRIIRSKPACNSIEFTALTPLFITTDAVNLLLGKMLGPDLVERLKISLLAAEALVGDAEFKQLDNPSVREWLNSLRDAVYVADDLLDAVLTKAATQKELPRLG